MSRKEQLEQFAANVRAILENPDNSGADCYDLVSEELRDIGLPVRDPEELE